MTRKAFVQCPICQGRGVVTSGATCIECTGSGRVTREADKLLRLAGRKFETADIEREG